MDGYLWRRIFLSMMNNGKRLTLNRKDGNMNCTECGEDLKDWVSEVSYVELLMRMTWIVIHLLNIGVDSVENTITSRQQ